MFSQHCLSRDVRGQWSTHIADHSDSIFSTSSLDRASLLSLHAQIGKNNNTEVNEEVSATVISFCGRLMFKITPTGDGDIVLNDTNIGNFLSKNLIDVVCFKRLRCCRLRTKHDVGMCRRLTWCDLSH